MADIATLGIEVDSRKVRTATTDLNKLENQSKQTTKATDSIASSLVNVGVALGGLAAAQRVFTTWLNNTRIQQAAEAQLEAAVRSTGGAAGFASEQLKKMASDIQGLTTFGDEAVISMQSVLLTFTKISGPEFKRAQMAIADMSVRLGQDLKSAAIQVGKALNDPILGVTSLSRAGVQFSDAQRDMIKHLVETGKQAQAQNLILQELEVQFGGAAAAAKNTLGGALDSLGNSFGDLFESSSSSTSGIVRNIKDLTSAIDEFNVSMSDSAKKADSFISVLAKMVTIANTVPVVLGAVFGGNLSIKELAGMDLSDMKEFVANIEKLTDLKPIEFVDKGSTAAVVLKEETEELEKKNQAIQKVIDNLQEEIAMSKMSSAEKQIANALNKAGVDALSEKGIEIIKLVKAEEALNNVAPKLEDHSAMMEQWEDELKIRKKLNDKIDRENLLLEQSAKLQSMTSAEIERMSGLIGVLADQAGDSPFAGLFAGLESSLSGFDKYEQGLVDLQENIFNLDIELAEKQLELDDATKNGRLEIAEKLSKQIGNIQEKRTAYEIDLEKKKNDSILHMSTAALDGISVALQGFASAQDTSNKSGFESAKKLNMGVAVVSTAAAIMRAFSDLGWPAGIPAAAAAAAMGAAQISNINSTSFGGGGGSVASIGAISLGSNSGYAPTTGTVLGDMGAMSQSTGNVEDLLESIHAKEYRELRSIAYSMQDLNANITGLVSSIVRSTAEGGGVLDGLEFGYSKSDIESWSDKVNEFFTSDLGGMGGFITEAISGGIGSLTGFIAGGISSIAGGGTEYKLKGTGYDIAAITAQEIQDGVDAYVQEYAYIKEHKKGSFGGSGSSKYYYLYEDANEDITDLFTKILGNLTSSVSTLALGLGGVEAQTAAMAYSFDIGKIELKDMDSEQINEVLSAMISTQADLFVEAVIGPLVKEYQKVDEGLLETATRLLVSKVLVVDSFEKIGKAYNDAEQALMGAAEGSIAVSNAIVEAAGGIEEYQKTIESFFDQFFTDIEKQAFRTENLTGIVDDMGMSLPATRQGYRDLTAAIDISTASGQAAYVQLLELTDQAGEYYDYLEQLQSDRFDLSIDFINAVGLSHSALIESREAELSVLDESLVSIQKAVWAREDYNATMDLQLKVMELEGKSLEVTAYNRMMELRALSDGDKILQERIYYLQDEAEMLENVKAKAEEANTAIIEGLQNQITLFQDDMANISGLLQRSADAERQRITDANESTVNALQARIDAMVDVDAATLDTISNLTSMIDTLNSAAESLRGAIPYVSAVGSLDAMLSSARSGNMPDPEVLSGTLSAITGQGNESYSSEFGFRRDQLVAANKIEELSGILSGQLSDEEQALKYSEDTVAALQSQIDQANEWMDKQLAAVDLQVQQVQEILDRLNGVDTSVVSMSEVINQAKILDEKYQDDHINLLEGQIRFQETAHSESLARLDALWDASSMNNAAIWASFNALQSVDQGINQLNALIVQSMQEPDIPQFASGGTHLGGLRIVGEKGPELEYTGPSNITSNATLRSMMSSGDSGTEVRELRQEQRVQAAAFVKMQSRMNKILDRWDANGMPQPRAEEA